MALERRLKAIHNPPHTAASRLTTADRPPETSGQVEGSRVDQRSPHTQIHKLSLDAQDSNRSPIELPFAIPQLKRYTWLQSGLPTVVTGTGASLEGVLIATGMPLFLVRRAKRPSGGGAEPVQSAARIGTLSPESFGLRRAAWPRLGR
jgi:hypothetical protein